MPPRIVRAHQYHQPDGSLLYEKQKIYPDGWRIRRPDGNGGWVYNKGEAPWILYRLPEVLSAVREGKWIGFPEGEHDAETLVELGKEATSLPYGAGKQIDLTILEPLRGAKVFLLGDNDDVGRRDLLTRAVLLDPIVAKLAVYEVPVGYKDVTALMEAGGSFKDLVPFDWQAARPATSPSSEAEITVLSMGELMATPELNEHDKLLGCLITRGARLVIGAHTGEGKTSWGLNVLRSILRGDEFLGFPGLGNGTRALVIDVEQGRRTVKRRFCEMGLHDYADQVKLMWVPDGLALDSDKRHVACVEEILAEGWDIVIADPLYKLHRGDANDERKAVDLMRLFDRWRTQWGFALVLPMHCRKPQVGSKFSIHDITGSSGYTRGAEVVVGLQRVKKGYSFLHWWKDREGDLDCINERWGLLFDQERGFRRDPQDLEHQPVRDRVRHALEAVPGMTLDDLREETEAKQSTLRRALDDIGAIHDGARLVAERHWRMPPTLWDATEAAVA